MERDAPLSLAVARRQRNRVHDDHGSMIVEAIFVIPVLMVILMTLVQFALWAHAAQVAQLAASEGDQAARAFGGGPAAGEIRANSILRGHGSDVSSSSTVVTVLRADMARITVTGTAVTILRAVTSCRVGSGRPHPGVQRIRVNRGRIRQEEGSLMIELAVLAPVLFVLALSIVVFGRVSEARQVVVEASRAGAQAAAVLPDPGSAQQGAADSAVIGLFNESHICADPKSAPT